MTSNDVPVHPGGPEPSPAPRLSDDALTADFRVWQRRGGHRYSLDDVLTAAEAVRAAPCASRVLDLGTGIGSVLLMIAWKMPRAYLVGVEAQDESIALARRNVERNAVVDRVALVHGDLRDPTLLAATGKAAFDLVTGTPPYFPPGTATRSPDPQRAQARHEVRGGVEAYVSAAARALAAGGRVALCADARRPDRITGPCAAVGLAPIRRLDAFARAGRSDPLFSVWTLAQSSEAVREAPVATDAFVARDDAGLRTEAYCDLRALFGLGSDGRSGGHG